MDHLSKIKVCFSHLWWQGLVMPEEVFQLLQCPSSRKMLYSEAQNHSASQFGPGVLLRCGLFLGPLARFCLHGDDFWGKEKILLEVKEGCQK